MSNQYHGTITNLPGKVVTRETGPDFVSGPLEVNVVITDSQSTANALKAAESLARDLGARICLRAVIAVPFQLPLERPAVSVPFLQEGLRKLAFRLQNDGFQPRAHLYLCRDRVQGLLQALKPNSLVVIGGRKHWWPTAESQMADALRAKGHRVIFVDSRVRSASEQPAFAR